MHEMRPIAINELGVCQSPCLSGGRDVLKRLNGSTSCLGWRLWEPKVVLDGDPHPHSKGDGWRKYL